VRRVSHAFAKIGDRFGTGYLRRLPGVANRWSVAYPKRFTGPMRICVGDALDQKGRTIFAQMASQDPALIRQLSRNPHLVNDENFVNRHADLKDFFTKFPDAREHFLANPGDFVPVRMAGNPHGRMRPRKTSAGSNKAAPEAGTEGAGSAGAPPAGAAPEAPAPGAPQAPAPPASPPGAPNP